MLLCIPLAFIRLSGNHPTQREGNKLPKRTHLNQYKDHSNCQKIELSLKKFDIKVMTVSLNVGYYRKQQKQVMTAIQTQINIEIVNY